MQTSQNHSQMSHSQMTQAQSHFLDIYRSMARAANDALTATLHTTELVSAQSHMFGNQVAQAVEFWRSAYRAVGEAQMNLMNQVQSQVGQATETVRQAYDLTRKASDEAARMTATQVTSMMSEQNGSGRQQRSGNGAGSHSRGRNGASHGRKRGRSRSAERRA